MSQHSDQTRYQTLLRHSANLLENEELRQLDNFMIQQLEKYLNQKKEIYEKSKEESKENDEEEEDRFVELMQFNAIRMAVFQLIAVIRGDPPDLMDMSDDSSEE